MITEVQIKNFKCFADRRLELRPLTVLAGINGSGKSSFIQSLLLVKQALESTPPRFIRLNGPDHVFIGQAVDALHSQANVASIEVDVSVEGAAGQGEYKLRMDAGDAFSQVLRVESFGFTGGRGDHRESHVEMKLVYVAAERLGPRDVSETAAQSSDELHVGSRGEFCAQVLSAPGVREVRDALLHPDTEKAGGAKTLGKQVELWMADLVPSIEMRANAFPGTNAVSMQMKKFGMKTEWLRATNMGFGVSYALPIVVAGLIADSSTVLLIENPEAHLHPAGQSSMGRFLAHVAAQGTQVILETHSDHVLNGIRLAIVDSHPLEHDHARVLFFTVGEAAESEVSVIDFTPKGNLTVWPRGFFDQSERDLAAIVKSRRHG